MFGRTVGMLAAAASVSIGCASPQVSEIRREPSLKSGAPAMPPLMSLQDTLMVVATETHWRSPRTDLSITVRNLGTGESGSVNGSTLHVSASSAKAVWVAAALHGRGIDPVAPHADPVFRSSDNYASGAVIDLVGPNAVNDFQWDVAGMGNSALTQWSFGGPRTATNSPRAMGADNYFTSDDLVEFLARLESGSLLGGAETGALRSWMTLSPRSAYGGWLGTRLPADARASMGHKAGWLPPGCCGDDASYNTLNEAGVVQTPDGQRYAVAILARRGSDYWGRQVALVEYASCLVYRSVAQDATIECSRASDPVEPASCGSISYAGVCTDQVLTWCDAGMILKTKDCGATGRVCGWQNDVVGNNCLDAPPSTPPSACGDLTYIGKCEGTVLTWCHEETTLKSVNCANDGKTCGWQDEQVGYNCLAP